MFKGHAQDNPNRQIVEMDQEYHLIPNPVRGNWGLTFFFSFIFISWKLITLQYCSGFCHTLTWISHGFTCVPHPDPPSRLLPDPIPLGLPSAPALSTCLMHPTWAGDLFHPWEYTCFSVILSEKETQMYRTDFGVSYFKNTLSYLVVIRERVLFMRQIVLKKKTKLTFPRFRKSSEILRLVLRFSKAPDDQNWELFQKTVGKRLSKTATICLSVFMVTFYTAQSP